MHYSKHFTWITLLHILNLLYTLIYSILEDRIIIPNIPIIIPTCKGLINMLKVKQ